jgi:hypothetical protein
VVDVRHLLLCAVPKVPVQPTISLLAMEAPSSSPLPASLLVAAVAVSGVFE